MTTMTIYQEARETFLQILLLAENTRKDLEKQGDLAGQESLEKEVIACYEKLFLALEEAKTESFLEEQREEFQKFLREIQEKHQFTKEYLEEKMKLRESLKGHSGAEVVKRLLEYQKKELEKQKRNIMAKLNELLDQEERKNLEFCNAIQEEEQMKILEELQPIREKYRKISEKAIDIQKKIDYTVIEIEKKWKYEIFGTITEQKLKESYKEFAKKQKI